MNAISPRMVLEDQKSKRFLANAPVRIETRTDERGGEERVLELGHTNAVRVLFVASTRRGQLVRPITAFEANRKTRAAYHQGRITEDAQ